MLRSRDPNAVLKSAVVHRVSEPTKGETHMGALRNSQSAAMGRWNMVRLKAFAWSLILIVTTSALASCGATARLAVADGTGPKPVLPAPRRSLLPTVNVVTAKGWTGEEKPVATEGTAVSAFARGLDHPRWLYVLPNGDVLGAGKAGLGPIPSDTASLAVAPQPTKLITVVVSRKL